MRIESIPMLLVEMEFQRVLMTTRSWRSFQNERERCEEEEHLSIYMRTAGACRGYMRINLLDDGGDDSAPPSIILSYTLDFLFLQK